MTASTCQTRSRMPWIWLLRGALGVALLALAAWTRDLIVIVPACLAALIAFRGCPMCWAFELVERTSQARDSVATQEAP